MKMLTRREIIGGLAMVMLLSNVRASSATVPRKLFAMDTAMLRQFPALLAREDLVAIAKLGYSGVGPAILDSAGWKHFSERVVPWCRELQLEIPAVFSILNITGSSNRLAGNLDDHLDSPALARTTLWLQVIDEELPPSSESADSQIVEGLLRVSGRVKSRGGLVSIYPHFGSLIQTIPDALRIVTKVSQPNVGLTFNLCHFLRGEPDASLADTLRLASPHLQIATLCGADAHGGNWKQLIQPLDQGDYDLSQLLALFKQIGFNGPIGLQGYDVARNFHIEPQENLSRSMAAWHKLTESPRQG
jgi:sugar phosphate isomerase/epimerase